jgi:chemotaxis protein CheZ
MTDNTICSKAGLEFAKKLVVQIEQGKGEEAIETLEALSAMRESNLFQDLGKLTRDLHDTLTGFQLDTKISEMTETEIPDAKERLNHVITMTEEAADKTLSAVEKSLPLSEELKDKTEKFQESWQRFRKRDMDVDEFRSLSNELDEFFSWLTKNVPDLNSSLSEIMMAQGFQDLTGQIIRRVITLVQDVEESLVEIIRCTGQQVKQEDDQKTKKGDGPDIKAAGPVVPGIESGDVVSGQDEVDDLLSSLGF